MEKSDFSNYRALVLEVQHLRAKVAGLEVSLAAGGPYATEARRAKLCEIKALYEAQQARSEARVSGIERAIQSLESPIERQVMRLRYIEGWDWTRVCTKLQDLGYCDRHVYRLHGCALQKLRRFDYEKM